MCAITVRSNQRRSIIPLSLYSRSTFVLRCLRISAGDFPRSARLFKSLGAYGMLPTWSSSVVLQWHPAGGKELARPLRPPLLTANRRSVISFTSLGSPKKMLSLIFDTGSDLTWTQCRPCAKSCYKQKEPIFNPATSSSYVNISCSSATCSELVSGTGNTPGCASSTCVYGIQYGDQSFSVEFFFGKGMAELNTDGYF
ncbi:hypothetical protein ACFX2A_023122 [Malus domestica]